MESEFWRNKWETNNIGFHNPEPNALMRRNISALRLDKGGRVFLPLCGKTRDISWLLGNGFQVVGVELVESAIVQLFCELDLRPAIAVQDSLSHYAAKNIDIYVGDIFQLNSKALGRIDAVYDRAALVALPEAMRAQYAPLVVALTHTAPQLLISYEYDQNQMDGPPFSVTASEIQRLYEAYYQIKLIESYIGTEGLKKVSTVTENVWLLTGR